MSGECRNTVNGPCTAPRLATMESKMAWSLAGTWSLRVMYGRRGIISSVRWSSCLSYTGQVQLRIGRADVRFRQPELATHDVGAFHHRDALVVRDTAAETLAAEAAI